MKKKSQNSEKISEKYSEECNCDQAIALKLERAEMSNTIIRLHRAIDKLQEQYGQAKARGDAYKHMLEEGY